jgi:hypothetical protein
MIELAQRRAEKLVKQSEKLLDPGIAKPIINGLRILARCDELFLSELGKMLGQCRLAQVDAVEQLANGEFAANGQMAENK